MRYGLWIWLVCLPAHAGVYSYVDANGTRVFTDQPQDPRSTAVTLKPINQMQADSELIPTRILRPEQVPTTEYQWLNILAPSPDSTVQNGSGSLIVSVQSEPALMPAHQYRLLLNGRAYGEPSVEPFFTLEHVDRGSHSLSVEIINEKNQRQAISAAQTVHVRRISLADRRRVNPCQLADYGQRLECPLKDKPKPKRDIPFIPFL